MGGVAVRSGFWPNAGLAAASTTDRGADVHDDTMQFQISFDRCPSYVHIISSGEASVRGFERLITAMLASPAWQPGLKQLVDHRNLRIGNFSRNDIEAIVEFVKSRREKIGNGRCAFVVGDTLGFGLVRMYDLMGDELIHPELRIFYSEEEAVQWLAG